MKKTNPWSVGESYVLLLSLKITLYTLPIISYLKLYWKSYVDRKHYRKEVQRRLLRQRAIKKQKVENGRLQAGEQHWTERFLKIKSFHLRPVLYPLFFTLLFIFFGQQGSGQVVIKPLKVGDSLPDITLTQVSNYKSDTLKLSDFKGKLVILDFWASWCSPCVSLIPKMVQLQKEFEGKLKFITIAYESEKDVAKFNAQLEKRGIQNNLIQVVGDVKMGLYFPHTYLPHEVWINPKGEIIAITNEEAINSSKIQEALNHQLKVATKIDKRIPHDLNKPLFIQNNGGNGEGLLYHRTFSGFVDGLRSRSTTWVKPDGSTEITSTNTSYLGLCQQAYSGKGIDFSSRNRVVLDLKDSSEIIAPEDVPSFKKWEVKNRYCYELWAPPSFKDVVFEEMKQDLRFLFPKYTAQIEKRELPVWVLKRTSAIDKLASKGGKRVTDSNMLHFEIHNAPITQLTGMLDIKYLSLQAFPVLDETDYKGNVDLVLDANMSNVASINEALKAYDLELVKAKRTIPVLYITDHPTLTSKIN